MAPWFPTVKPKRALRHGSPLWVDTPAEAAVLMALHGGIGTIRSAGGYEPADPSLLVPTGVRQVQEAVRSASGHPARDRRGVRSTPAAVSSCHCSLTPQVAPGGVGQPVGPAHWSYVLRT